MRHSDFSSVYSALRDAEKKEFYDALSQHHNEYTFITDKEISKANAEYHRWEEDVPHVSSLFVEDEYVVDALVMRIYNGAYGIYIEAILARSHEKVRFPANTMMNGDFHHIMDFMKEP